MKRILVLTDFSDTADYALEAAVEFTKQHEADLHVYHVLSESDYIKYEMDSNPELITSNGKSETINTGIDSWRQRGYRAGIDMHMIIGSGDLIKGVSKLIKSHAIDLIIMGATGGGHTEDLWGSTTQNVIKKLDAPVLIIKSQMKDYRMDNIVFASDLDEEDQDVLKRSLSLIKPSKDAIIHLMSVNTSSFFSQPMAIMKSALQDFQEMAKPFASDTRFYNDYSITAGIRHYLEEVKPDMLIMSYRERHPIIEFLKPNSTTNVIENVQCPVLVLKHY